MRINLIKKVIYRTMAIKICDLHTHSTFSDGTATPEELIRAAKACGLAAVALTDHNTVSGLPDFLAAAEEAGIEAIAGTEISAVHGEREMHIVGLGIAPRQFGAVTAFFAPYREAKEGSTRALVEALTKGGYPLDYDALLQGIDGQPNRAHVASALVAAGYVSSVKEAFDTLLGTEHGFYREPVRPTAEEAIALLHSVGARAVLAHPFYDFTEEELTAFLGEVATWEHRFDAMETRYSEYSEEEAAAAARIAAHFGLKESGGSDFHGERKPDIALGAGRGNLIVPYEFWECLKP